MLYNSLNVIIYLCASIDIKSHETTLNLKLEFKRNKRSCGGRGAGARLKITHLKTTNSEDDARSNCTLHSKPLEPKTLFGGFKAHGVSTAPWRCAVCPVSDNLTYRTSL